MVKQVLVLNDRVRVLRDIKVTRRHSSVLKRAIADELASFEITHDVRAKQSRGMMMFEVEIDGIDAIAASNYLRLRHGGGIEPAGLKLGMAIARARWDRPGSVGFGTFVDIGVAGSNALYPLYGMRQQLAGGKQHPVKWFEKAFGVCDGFAIDVVLQKISPEGKLFVELSGNLVQELASWRQDGCDRVFCHGETTLMVERALRVAGVNPEHAIIQETAFLDSIITCDDRTDGAGLVALIGRALPHLSMGVFNAREINKTLNAKE